jgi:hypothetical protein
MRGDTSTTHPQLDVLARELGHASARAREIVARVSDEGFHRRPGTGWSAAECIAHLNLSNEAMLPLIDGGLREAAARSRPTSPSYRRDLTGWLLSWYLEPPYRRGVKTPAQFEPASTGSKEEILAEFLRLQDELVDRLRIAAGLDLNRVRIVSPFNARARYNLYSAFRVITAHERRHLYQAETALAA